MYQLSAELVLASASPRRKELLNGCGIKFDISSADIDESVKVGEDPQQLVLRLAEGKVKAIAARFPNHYILGADTDVALGRKIFGKPKNIEEARNMLQELSGKTHQVLGGIALLDPNLKKIYAGLSVTSVTFRVLRHSEIEAYVNTNEPYDKAGGYAAQGLGASFIKVIEGSYTNVVGLDLSMALGFFREAGILTE